MNIEYKDDSDLLSRLGIQNDFIVNALVKSLDSEYDIIRNEIISSNVYIPYGSPIQRAYNTNLQLNYNNLYHLINNVFKDNIILTIADTVKKLRTPQGVRIGEWHNCHGYNKISIDRILLIYFLIKDCSNKITITNRLPAGIYYETVQTETINNYFKNNNSLKRLYINNDYTGILFNKAVRINNNGKADIALLNNDKEVFWISYKHGNQHDVDVSFQQYGSLYRLYKKHKNILKNDLDIFFKSIIDSKKAINIDIDKDNISISLDLIKDFVDDRLPLNKIVSIIKSNSQLKKLIIIKSGTCFWSKKINDSFKLKSLFGLDYSENSLYGRENVNIILQTSNKIKFDQKNIDELHLSLDNNSKIIFNSEIPSNNYNPVLYARKDNRNWFMHDNTLLVGRIMIYPEGKISNHHRMIEV